MDQLLIPAITQVPGLVVLVVLVRWFLAHMKERDEGHLANMKERDDFLKGLHDQYMESLAESRETIKDNVLATRQNSVALQELKDVIRRCPNAL